MIEFKCDRCDRTLTATPAQAGQKIECPDCGDVNVVPEPADRAVAAGLPPDSGPEERVMLVRPSLWRSHPLSTIGLMILPVVVPIIIFASFESAARAALWTLIVLGGLCWGTLGILFIRVSLSHSIEITNKRTLQRDGLLSKSTTEVMHDHVRNIQIEQSFIDRIFKVGAIGISSSGQDGIEVSVRGIPQPRYVKEIVDKYRPM